MKAKHFWASKIYRGPFLPPQRGLKIKYLPVKQSPGCQQMLNMGVRQTGVIQFPVS